MSELCPVCYESPIKNKLTLTCNHAFCYLCIRGILVDDRAEQKCPYCRANIDKNFINSLTTNDIPVPTVDDPHYWIYSGRTDGWWKYEIDQSRKIEILYKKYKQRKLKIDSTDVDSDSDSDEDLTIAIGSLTIEFDFDDMIQRTTKGERKIMRVKKGHVNNIPGIIKGYAGIPNPH